MINDFMLGPNSPPLYASGIGAIKVFFKDGE
jgi:hypothetical protein